MGFSNTPTAGTASIMGFKKETLDNKLIIIENIISGKDKRTTVMLRNIPLKYTIQNLIDELNISFAGKFDFVNMPTNSDVSPPYY